MAMGDRGQLGHRLKGARLVVGRHHRDQDRVLRERLFEVPGGDQASAVDGQYRHPEPVEASQGQACLEHGWMLGGLGDNVRARRPGSGQDAMQGQKVGLGPGTGEHDLSCGGSDQLRHPLASVGQRLSGKLAVTVGAGRVPEMLDQVGEHRLSHSRVDRGRGVVVQIDGPVGQPGVRRR